MRRVILLALNDLRQVAKDRPALFWMVAMPIGFIFLFGQMDRGEQRTVIGLTVLDRDDTVVSRAFGDALTREGFRIQRIASQGSDSLGSARRTLTLPSGFQDSLAAGQAVTAPYYVDPEADAEASLLAEMHMQRASLSTLLALSLLARDHDSLPLAFDAVRSAELDALLARPRGVSVSAETAGRGRAVPSGMRHSLPATLALFMLINTTIYGAVFLAIEKQERILARLASQPLSRVQILGGKLLGAVLIGLVQAFILLLAGRFLFGAFLGHSLAGLALVVLCLALVAGALALFWGAVLRTPEQVTATTIVTALFLGAIGGCWWPLEVVPGWMQIVGHVSPAAWAMDGFHALISFGGGVGAVALPCLVLLGYALVFLLISSRLLRFAE